MQKSTKWFIGILSGLILFGIIVVVLLSVLMMSIGEGTEEEITGNGQKIAVVEVFGPIYSSEEIVRQLKKYRKESSIKAVLVHVNSPGGGVAASQEIYEEIKYTSEEKPVVISMSSVAASGGYYIACGAKKIVANAGTITGSIGVISQFWEVSKLMEKIGVQNNTIKSGKLKDSGNPFRAMSDEEKQYFQNLSSDIHQQFMEAVEDARHLSHEQVMEIADGRVYSGRQAFALGLVDTLGTYENAVRITADEAGINDEPAIVKEVERLSLVEKMFGTTLGKMTELKEELLNQPVLQYKMPGSW